MDNIAPPPGFEVDQAAAPSIGPTPVAQSGATELPPGFELDNAQDKTQLPPGFQLDSERFTTPGQQVETGIEGAARGMTAGLSDALAVGMRKGASALGVPEDKLHYIAPNPEEMAARKEQNPVEAGASELAGNMAMMANLPQIGGRAINSMIQMGVISGGDELSKAMLGTGDPTPAVAAHIVKAGAIGLLTGGLFGKLEKVAPRFIENQKLGTKLNSFLAGLGHAATIPGEDIVSLAKSAQLPAEAAKLSDTFFKLGQTVYKNMGTAAAAKAGHHFGGEFGALGGIGIEKAIEKIVAPYTSRVSQKYIAPMILNAAKSGYVTHLTDLIDHATSCSQGAHQISKGVEALFNAGSNKFLEYEKSERDRDKLKDFVENGGVQSQILEPTPEEPPAYAEGGEVQPMQELNGPNPVRKLWPDQDMMLATTKGRVSKYLNSIRPLPPIKQSPFDSDHKNPQQEREYHKMLDIANQPLSVLKHIKHGSLTPKQVMGFRSMYPELHDFLLKKINDHIIHHKVKEKVKPSYKMRQALSLFLGQNMDSTLSQPNIMAAQSVFMQQRAQQAQVPKKESSLSKIGEHAMTDDQARERRLNKN